MQHKNTNRRDANEAGILTAFRECGCEWIPLLPGQGADGLLITRHGIYVVEIKNPANRMAGLTHNEAALRDRMAALGQEYHVIYWPSQARQLAENGKTS